MERELIEETGIKPEHIQETLIIGHARLLHYGGKPEYFGITIVSANENDVKIRTSEKPFVRQVEWLRIFGVDSETYLNSLEREVSIMQNNEEISVVLLANMIAFRDFLKNGNFDVEGCLLKV